MRNQIKKYRKSNGLTMKSLADKIGTTASQINKLEKGERRLTADWMQKLAGALGCSPLDLFVDGGGFSHSSNELEAHSRVLNLHVSEDGQASAWHIPKAVFSKNGFEGENLAIVPVLQRDLEPDVRLNDYVVIDQKDALPSPAGVFVLEERGQLVLRHCAVYGRAQAQRIKVTAMQQSATGETVKNSTLVRVKDVHIKGRVIGHWHWV